jgi:hypothetical protein
MKAYRFTAKKIHDAKGPALTQKTVSAPKPNQLTTQKK